MIAKLTGKVASIEEGTAVIDVGGVGYLVWCAARTLSALPAIGSHTSLYVETVVREDQFNLYGFVYREEREWFCLLKTVQGVGAKMALSIIDLFSPSELEIAIAAKDHTTLVRVSGVGRKLADRIIIELKDKAPNTDNIVNLASDDQGSTLRSDAISALVNLGYRQTEAFNVVSGAFQKMGPTPSVEELIQFGLKELNS